MTDQMQTIRDDIAYLKALAEEGREGSYRGGAIGVAAGVIYAASSIMQWAALTGRAPQIIATWTSTGGTVLFVCILVWVKLRGGAARGRVRSANIAWTGVGWAIFALIGALAIASWRMQTSLLLYFFPSIIFALYGAAWTVAALVMKKTWMTLTAAGSFLSALVCAWFIKDPVQYLIYAAGLLMLAALPSAVMMHHEHTSTSEH